MILKNPFIFAYKRIFFYGLRGKSKARLYADKIVEK